MDAALLELATYRATHRPLSSRDAYGKRTYGVSAILVSYLDEQPAQVLSESGDEVTASAALYVLGTVVDGDPTLTLPTITLNDEIELTNGATPPIVKIQTLRDNRGSQSLIVWLGSTEVRV